jgi:hypothetical protein
MTRPSAVTHMSSMTRSSSVTRSSSFPRRRESRLPNADVGLSTWILAFAGMTVVPPSFGKVPQ